MSEQVPGLCLARVQQTDCNCNSGDSRRPDIAQCECSTLQLPTQYTATRCNTLQHTAIRYNTLQHIATHCNTPPTENPQTHMRRQQAPGRCLVQAQQLSHVSPLEFFQLRLLLRLPLQLLFPLWPVWQYAVRCSAFGVLQCVAECCIVLRCVAACVAVCVAVSKALLKRP